MTGERKNRLPVNISHGTYGHFDDARGAMTAATSYLSSVGDTTIMLRGDGTYMAVSGQDPREVGVSSMIELLDSYIEIGGRIVVVKEDMMCRAIWIDDVQDHLEIIEGRDLAVLLKEHDIGMNS